MWLTVNCNFGRVLYSEEKARAFEDFYFKKIQKKAYAQAYKLTSESYREKVSFPNFVIHYQRINALYNNHTRVFKKLQLEKPFIANGERLWLAQFTFYLYSQSKIAYIETIIATLGEPGLSKIEVHRISQYEGHQEYVSNDEVLQKQPNLILQDFNEELEKRSSQSSFANCNQYSVFRTNRKNAYFFKKNMPLESLLDQSLVNLNRLHIIKDEGILAVAESGFPFGDKIYFISGKLKVGNNIEHNIFIVTVDKNDSIIRIEEFPFDDFYIEDSYMHCK